MLSNFPVKWIGWMLIGMVVIYLGLLIFLFYAQKFLLFQGVRLPGDYVFEFEQAFEEILIADQINALYFKAPDTTKGVVLYLHGNADNLQRWAKHSAVFTKRNYDALFIDYQGYGKSQGTPSEAALYHNARAAYDYLRTSFAEDQIILYGRSLGCAPATQLATQVPAKHLILETPFNSLRGLYMSQLPFGWLPYELDFELSNEQNIPKVTMPITIFQGTADWVVPYRSAIQLRPLLKPGDHFHTVEGGSHRDLAKYPIYESMMNEIVR